MQYFASLFVTTSLLVTGTTAVVAESQEAHQYPEKFKQGYAQECVQTSIAEGLAQEEAQKLCQCTLSKFQNQYSLEEFQQLTNASIQDEQAEMALVEVGQVCFEEMLYEQ